MNELLAKIEYGDVMEAANAFQAVVDLVRFDASNMPMLLKACSIMLNRRGLV